MTLPLYGFLQGDTIGMLIVAEQSETIADLAQKLQDAASIRVAPFAPARVRYRNATLDPAQTLAEAGFSPLDRFDVVRGE